jgi:hypothetical protein
VSVVANVAVNVDARQATQNLQQLQRQSTAAANSIEKTGRSAASASANIQRFGIAFRSVVAPVVAITGAVNILSRSLRVLGERQADAAALENGLRKIGGTRSDLRKLQEVADQLGKQTLFNQEDFDRGFALLTSFQSIAIGSYERVAKAAADVAQVTKQDVNSSLLQLAKALQDPEKGLTALARSGTQFSESQKDVIKSLVETGKQAEAQDYILREIEKQYGNAAAAAGSAGYAGAVDSLQESFRDFQERLATGVEPAVIGTLKALTDLFDIASKIPPPVGNAALAIGGVATAVIGLRAAIVAVLPVAKSLLAFALANPWIALAAGITAAAVALAGYRSEAEKVAGAARTGTPADVAAARNLAVQKGQSISLLEARRGQATGRERASIDRQLTKLRREQADLLDAARQNALDSAAGPFVTTTDGGGVGESKKKKKGTKDKAAEEEARLQARLRGIQIETNAIQKQSDVQQRILQAQIDGDEQLAIRLQGMEREQQIIANLQGSLVGITDQRERQAVLTKAAAELDAVQAQTAGELNKFEVQRAEAIENAMRPLEEQRQILEATLEGRGEEVRLQLEIERILKATPGLEREKVEQILRGNAELERQAESAQQLKELYQNIANTIASSLGSAIDAAVSGTENLGDALKKLGRDLLATIGKMLIMYAIGQALGAISGGKGALGYLAKGFGFKGAKDGAYWSGGFEAFANGGVVTSPTMGLIGEGGEPEYVIPASKMSAAMSRYSAGARGSAVIPGNGASASGGGMGSAAGSTIDVRYTIERINSVDYVTADQFQRGMQQAAQQGAAEGQRQTLRRLQNSPSTRRRIGV